MEMPDLKALKKLADMCRKAGIKSFKCESFEFTLIEDAPVSSYKANKVAKTQAQSTYDAQAAKFESDSPTESELLFWSSADLSQNQAQSDAE